MNFLSLCDLRSGAGLLLLLLLVLLVLGELPNEAENVDVLVPAEAVLAGPLGSPNLLWLGLRNPGSHLRLRKHRGVNSALALCSLAGR